MKILHPIYQNWRFIFSLLFLNMADFYLTKELIETGRVIEANPFLAWAIDYFETIWAILWIKSVGLSLLFYSAFFQVLNEKLMHFVIWIYIVVVIYSMILTGI